MSEIGKVGPSTAATRSTSTPSGSSAPSSPFNANDFFDTSVRLSDFAPSSAASDSAPTPSPGFESGNLLSLLASEATLRRDPPAENTSQLSPSLSLDLPAGSPDESGSSHSMLSSSGLDDAIQSFQASVEYAASPVGRAKDLANGEAGGSNTLGGQGITLGKVDLGSGVSADLGISGLGNLVSGDAGGVSPSVGVEADIGGTHVRVSASFSSSLDRYGAEATFSRELGHGWNVGGFISGGSDDVRGGIVFNRPLDGGRTGSSRSRRGRG